jgi:hypothetical protein
MAVYRFKISFEDYEDIYREIEVNSSQSFAEFYSAILTSIGFENHGSASFYMSNDSWKKGTEISTTDKKDKSGKAVARADKALFKNYIADPHQKIYLLIESESNWAFHIELIKILPAADLKTTYPHIRKTIGEAPKQFKVVIPPAVDDETEFAVLDDIEETDTSQADDYDSSSSDDYDADETNALEGEEGEQEEGELDDVELNGDENYEEEV